jgi:hypothetical protein
VTCYLLTRRIICGLRFFVSRFIGYYIRRRLQSLITLPITSHEPATSSGSSSAPSWHKPLLRIFRDELLVMNSYSRLLLGHEEVGWKPGLDSSGTVRGLVTGFCEQCN